MKLILCFFVLALSGCVATQKHAEKTARLLHGITEELAHLYPNNQRIQGLARKTGAHAESGAGFDFSPLFQLLSLLGGPGGLGLGALGIIGTLSPGLKLGKKKKA